MPSDHQQDPFDALDVAAAPRELVALGGVLDAATLRSAYRNGVFPWPPSPQDAAEHERVVRRLARRGAVAVLPGTPPGRSCRGCHRSRAQSC